MSRKRKIRRQSRVRLVYQERRVIDQSLVWFIVRTIPMGERRAFRSLRLEGFDAWLPQFQEVTTRRGRARHYDRRFMPRYMFVGLKPNDRGDLPFARVRECDGVFKLLGNERPQAIGSALLQVLADRMTGNNVGHVVDPKVLMQLGQLVRVINGPFASFPAMITAILTDGYKADVEIFGRKTPVHFQHGDLESAA
ncbi:MAG TPA: transcription termination/antitermination NusG family protein [Microvirga sp.]|jgi:transcription antitermination factor NusG|nr:transcription termination/antitermination NusG family protein [Microvirga sp.]